MAKVMKTKNAFKGYSCTFSQTDILMLKGKLKTLVNITCNKEGLHSWRWLWWFKKFIDVLLRKRGLSSALTLDIFLLTSLLILKTKRQNQNAAGTYKAAKKSCFQMFSTNQQVYFKNDLFKCNSGSHKQYNAIHSLFQFTRHSPSHTPAP